MSKQNLEEGGICYVACMELFSFLTNSRSFCFKGCDFAEGRVNDPELRKEAEKMCKRLTAEAIDTQVDLDNIKDLRVHATMQPNSPQNVYKACLAGIRRQRY